MNQRTLVVQTADTADKVVGGALLVALIAMFLPWYGVSFTLGRFGSSTSSVNGFHRFGWLYFIAWLVAVAYMALRLFDPNNTFLTSIKLPVWQVIMGLGAVMVLAAVIFWLDLPSGSGDGFSVGVQWGWWIAVLAALAVVVGGYLKRDPEALNRLSARVPSSGAAAPYPQSSPAGPATMPPAAEPTPAAPVVPPVASTPTAPEDDAAAEPMAEEPSTEETPPAS